MFILGLEYCACKLGMKLQGFPFPMSQTGFNFAVDFCVDNSMMSRYLMFSLFCYI